MEGPIIEYGQFCMCLQWHDTPEPVWGTDKKQKVDCWLCTQCGKPFECVTFVDRAQAD